MSVPTGTTGDLQNVTSAAAGSSSSIARSTILATVATFAGYATTLVQQLFYARSLGVGADTDALAAALAWAINTTGLVGWTITSVLVPPYMRALSVDALRARALFRSANAVALAIGVALAVATFAFASPLSEALLPGSSFEARHRLVGLLRISAPLHFLWIAVLTAMALANARERYFVAAASTVLPSLPIILVLALSADPSVELTAAAYVVGEVVQLLALLFAVRPWWRDFAPSHAARVLTPIAGRIIPIGAGFLLLNAANLAARAIASLGGTGDVAVVDYATRLTGAVETLVLAGALAVAMTTWSADGGSEAKERLPVARAFRVCLGLAIATAGALALMAGELISMLFGGGRFSPSDVEAVGSFLGFIAPGMAGRMLVLLAIRVLLARASSWALATAGAVAIVAVSAFSLVGREILGLHGIGLGYSLGWILAAVAATAIARGAMRESPRLFEEVVRASAATALAMAAATAALALVGTSTPVRLAAGFAAFGAAGFAAGWALDVSLVRASAAIAWRLGRRAR